MPCRQRPDGEALCSVNDAMSCECYKRCREFFCIKDSKSREFCHKGPPGLDGRPCYCWQGVPPDQQFSRIPEPEEEGKVKCFESFTEDAQEVPCSEAYNWHDHKYVPLSKCKDRCNQNGYCAHWPREQEPSCKCYRRSFEGATCEKPVNSCYNGCNGRGICRDQFCHCKPPYFSIDCSRSKVYPANYSLPNPADLKINMYDISTQLSYEYARFAGFHQFDEI
ncbi:hypothetical protein ABPG75_001760 [Micractinium tetrahymenae]